MRARVRTSLIAAAAAFCIASCAAPPRPPQTEGSARRILLTESRVQLRASAYVELWLASRHGDAALVPALARCEDDPCAMNIGGPDYAAALPEFLATQWRDRETSLARAMEVTHSLLDPDADRWFDLAARALGVDLGPRPLPIDLVTETTTDRALAVASPCFTRDRRAKHPEARLVDCLFVHALADAESPIRDLLPSRAWRLLVVDEVAFLLRLWEPRHLSWYRQQLGAEEGSVLSWLEEDRERRVRGAEGKAPTREELVAFARRFAEQWESVHSGR